MVQGQIYAEKNSNNLYEVFGSFFHWETKILYIQFISYRTGSVYVLEGDKFRAMTELFLDNDDTEPRC